MRKLTSTACALNLQTFSRINLIQQRRGYRPRRSFLAKQNATSDERRTRRGESRAIARRARVIGAEAPGATWHPHAQPGRPFSAPRPRAPAPGPPPVAPPVTLGSLPLGSRGRDAIGATTTPRPTPRRMDQIDRIFPGSRASSANGTKLAPPRFFFFGPVHLRRFSARPRDRSLEANPIGARRSSARRGPGTIGTT